MTKPEDYDDITERRMAITLVPSEAPPTERDIALPTERSAPSETLPAPPTPDIPKDKYRDKLPWDTRGWRPGD